MSNRLRRLVLAVAVASLAALPAKADEPKGDPGALAVEGLQKLVQALDQLIRSIPQYEKPEITDDGDIIIRRKRPSEADRLPDADQGPTGPRKSI